MMSVRLRYIGSNPLIPKDKILYVKFKQNNDFSITIKSNYLPGESTCTYKNLEKFLKSWRILSINKAIENVRPH